MDEGAGLGLVRRRRIGWALGAVVAIAAAAVAVVLVTSGASRGVPPVAGPRAGVPLTDTAATPPGWAPVAYGDAQISVPAGWFVETDGLRVCGGHPGGMVFVGAPPNLRSFRTMPCTLMASRASILPAAASRAASAGPSRVVNGIPVIAERSPRGTESYLVPSLQVRVTASGPLASRILGTLTRSPLSVVLAPGPRFPAPAGWRWRRFGGIRFATPAGWPLQTGTYWGCPGIYRPLSVQLSAATDFEASSYGCDEPPDAGHDVARSGVVVGAGPVAVSQAVSASGRRMSCALHSGLRMCVLQPGHERMYLALLVYAGGHGRRAIVEIGLGRDGVLARTIFDSIGPQ